MSHDAWESSDPFLDPGLVDRIEKLMVADEVASADLPHVVACAVAGTSIISFIGPFPNGMAALVHADQEAQRCHPDDNLEYSVFPVCEPSPPPGRHRAGADH